jgi:hypothetical protein
VGSVLQGLHDAADVYRFPTQHFYFHRRHLTLNDAAE